jgi:serine/threonine protein kinase
MDLLQPGDPRKVGRYQLIGRLGEGGMGRVYLGMSPGRRQVAVKLIRDDHVKDPQFRERFAREIKAARQVGGFHTATVVDADPNSNPPWMVTAYIHGLSLQDAVAQDGPLSLDQLCELGAGLAEGLEAIHACGLVHRDLKPSNVILAEDGPRIIDFGIARAATASAVSTVGSAPGTVSYMSPEQLCGELVGPASDVFSLGCTLVYAATARTAFGQDSVGTVVRRITTQPPDLAGVPRERGFRQLIGECLAKSPADRPALGAALTRLTGEDPAERMADADPGYGRQETGHRPTDKVPTGDRLVRDNTTDPGGSGGKPFTWPAVGSSAERRLPQESEPRPGGGSRRRRIPRRPAVIVAGVAVVVLLGTGLGILFSSGGTGQAHHTAAPRTHSAAAARTHSATPPPVITPPAQPEATLHDPKGKTIYGLVFSSDSVLATGDSNGSAYLWNVPGRTLTATLHDPASGGVNDIAFSRNGNLFVTADATGDVYLWNAESYKLIATLRNKNGRGAYSVAISPDGGLVAVGDNNGSAFLWNVAGGRFGNAPAATLHDPGGKGAYSVKFSPDGGALASGDLNGSTYLWNVATGKLTRSFRNTNNAEIYDIAFSPDGRYLAASDSTSDASVFLWNVSTGKLVATLHSADSVAYERVAFSPDNRFVAVADTGGEVHVWKVPTGEFVGSVFNVDSHPLVAVAFSPGGDVLAASDRSGYVYLWPTKKWLNP